MIADMLSGLQIRFLIVSYQNLIVKYFQLFHRRFCQNLENFPKVGGVWGDLKSKFRSKTSFLKRLDLIFAKKNFSKKNSRSSDQEKNEFFLVVTHLGESPLLMWAL